MLRLFVFSLSFAGFLPYPGCPADARTGESAIETRVDTTRVLQKNILGFGIQWEYEGDRPGWNIENPLWLSRWPEILRRVEFMRPGLVRVMHDTRMYGRLENNRFVVEPDSPRLRTTYRILDFTRDHHIPVLFGEWWLPAEHSAAIGGITSPRWSKEAIIPFLRHLRESRGYEQIRWFNLCNEPGSSYSFEDWRSAVLRLDEALKEAGFSPPIRIVGTDGPGDWNGWIEKSAADPELRDALGAYEYHLYAHLRSDKWSPSLLEGLLETGELRPKRELVNRLDPDGPAKPFFMGEAGIDDGNTGDNQIHRAGFEYGVWMADYAAQSLRAGQAGLIFWCLDDAMHFGGSHGKLGLKGWGFWNTLAGSEGYAEEEFQLRPVYYTWSLASRLFPSGSSTILVPPSGDSAVRVAAATPPGGGISVMLVNQSAEMKRVRLWVPGLPDAPLARYVYRRENRMVDGNGFPKRVETHEARCLGSGFVVEIPGPGVVFLSTLADAP